MICAINLNVSWKEINENKILENFSELKKYKTKNRDKLVLFEIKDVKSFLKDMYKYYPKYVFSIMYDGDYFVIFIVEKENENDNDNEN